MFQGGVLLLVKLVAGNVGGWRPLPSTYKHHCYPPVQGWIVLTYASHKSEMHAVHYGILIRRLRARSVAVWPGRVLSGGGWCPRQPVMAADTHRQPNGAETLIDYLIDELINGRTGRAFSYWKSCDGHQQAHKEGHMNIGETGNCIKPTGPCKTAPDRT